jgi:hypothetical protein
MRAQVNFEIEPAEDRKCQRCRATIKLTRKLLDLSTGREVRMFECTTAANELGIISGSRANASKPIFHIL